MKMNIGEVIKELPFEIDEDGMWTQNLTIEDMVQMFRNEVCRRAALSGKTYYLPPEGFDFIISSFRSKKTVTVCVYPDGSSRVV